MTKLIDKNYREKKIKVLIETEFEIVAGRFYISEALKELNDFVHTSDDEISEITDLGLDMLSLMRNTEVACLAVLNVFQPTREEVALILAVFDEAAGRASYLEKNSYYRKVIKKSRESIENEIYQKLKL